MLLSHSDKMDRTTAPPTAFHPFPPLAGYAGKAGYVSYNVREVSETKKVYGVKVTPLFPHSPQIMCAFSSRSLGARASNAGIHQNAVVAFSRRSLVGPPERFRSGVMRTSFVLVRVGLKHTELNYSPG